MGEFFDIDRNERGVTEEFDNVVGQSIQCLSFLDIDSSKREVM